VSRLALVIPSLLSGSSRPGRSLIVLGTGLAVGLAVAGCGGIDTAAVSSTPTPSSTVAATAGPAGSPVTNSSAGPSSSGPSSSGPSSSGLPSSGPSSSSRPATSSTGNSTSSTQTSTSPSIKEAKVAVYYAVEGGFANLRRSVAIAGDGSLDIDRNGLTSKGELSQEQLASIQSELDRSGLFDRNREYPAPKGSADLQRYEIRYRGATVVAHDTTVPAELSRAITLLEQATGQG
jgi:hypothetical protein